MSIYMNVDGITGDATQQGFTQWIQLFSCQLGVGRGITTATGATKNREAHEPQFGEIIVTKPLDSSSGPIFQALCTDSSGKEVKIAFVTTGNPGKKYLEYTLKNTLFSSYSISGGGDDRPNESLSLNFTEIALEITPLEASNDAAGPFHYTYDLAQAASS